MAKRHERRHHSRIDHPGGEEAIRFELFSTERLEQHAKSLALAQKNCTIRKGLKLLPRVHENSQVLLEAYLAITKALKEQHAITPAAEWLLDNFHVIEEQVTSIDNDLPESYYRKLPKLSEGVLAGYPRVYGIVWAIIAHTDSHFDPELLKIFVNAYQQIDPLTLGELWAIPITLRMLLVENLRRIAVRVMRSQTGRKLADDYVDTIEQLAVLVEKADSKPPESKLPEAELCQPYVVQILQRLHDPHSDITIPLDYINVWLGKKKLGLDDVVHLEHGEQIADNSTVRNIIISMRAISTFEWIAFVEDTSLVNACLGIHGSYTNMDFLTRDRYRHAIEDLARLSAFSELEIAQKVIAHVLEASECSPDELRQQDAGYYLIGAGRFHFEKEINYRTPLKNRLLRSYIANAGCTYIGSIVLVTLLILAIPFGLTISREMSGLLQMLLLMLAAFPASDIAVGVINRIIIAGLPPRHLPRLELKNGVPDKLATFVVVPTLFNSLAGIIDQIEQMEVRYLSNPDGRVFFALLSDWTDSDMETMPNDELLLAQANSRVAALNDQYGEQRFFVFHRKRLWNASEGKWMGWERKRGKLHEFNRLLRGATDTTFLAINGKPAATPPDVCYVITLDADTKLPMGIVAQMVGVAAHPLNQPVFDPDSQSVIDGYGIFQPRVTPTLPERQDRSLFHQIFSGASGTDAYSSSVSELYQDLFTLGTYNGKGLYHVDTFEAALFGRVPDNTQLSHDLFESVFVRCALVSDLEFFDEFPSHTDVAASREHRWTRGDWQLLPWILGFSGRNLPLLGRWKMLDNLRRSLSAPGAFFTLVASWAIPDAPVTLLMTLVFTALGLPVLLAIISSFSSPRQGVSLGTHFQTETENVQWALGNSIVTLTFLSQNTWQMLDAIYSTLVRLLITRRQLLKWVTALAAKSAATHSLQNLIRPLLGSSAVVIGASVLILFFNPAKIAIATPFLLLWWLAPIAARSLSLAPKVETDEQLLTADSQQLRLAGRRIWRFFTHFVTAEDNWLPPDNFQEDPKPVIAHRSSPTNFGLYLLSIIAARDFGWLGLMDTVDRLEVTLKTLESMARLHGHFYNWYDTTDLHVLEPKYISTVDSGNLAGHLLTLSEACNELQSKALSFDIPLTGLLDTWQLLMDALEKMNDKPRTYTVTEKELKQKISIIGDLLKTRPVNPFASGLLWRQLSLNADRLQDLVAVYVAEHPDTTDNEVLIWTNLLRDDINSHVRDVERLIPWIYFSDSTHATDKSASDFPLCSIPENALDINVSINELSARYAHCLKELDQLPDNTLNQDVLTIWSLKLKNAGTEAQAISQRLQAMSKLADSLFHEMDFSFLYDKTCNLFSIGYQVQENTLDSSYYDLLASEARLASLIAIAKRDIPSEHWFHLGRRVTRAAGGTVLLSWSGSMFEYLMPSLVTFTPRYSLLDQTCRLVVKRQIEYGKLCAMPWGVSESAFNVRDLLFTYQYSAFGVPGLGMKRGLGEEKVIAPYATALAAMYLPHAAAQNMKRLEALGALGRFGFYEAIDFTPVRLAENMPYEIMRCYMAHHQGMSLIAFANTVHDGIMRHRFHRSPLIQSADLLLQERIPRGADTIPLPLLQEIYQIRDFVQQPVRRKPSPVSFIPSTQLLSNGHYAVMITAAGSGYSVWQNLAVTRWREDVTRDAYGNYIFLRDIATGQVWSAGYQPTTVKPDRYETVFAEDRVRIMRTDGTIDTTLEIVVSPEDDAEIHRLSLNNKGADVREIEVTSYAEIVLTSLSADISHPVFSNLFVQTEYLQRVHALIAHRRLRSGTDSQLWAGHVLSGRVGSKGVQYETDRSRFIGRGQTLKQAIAVMDGRPLSNTAGNTLDPVFSLRTRLRIAPGTTEHLTFTTLVTASRQLLEDKLDKYASQGVFERVSAMAWTHAHVQLHHLRTRPDEAQLFQGLANRLLFADPSLRPASKIMQMNTLNVTGLWRHGISGDKPILLLRVKEPEDRTIVEQLLRAHEYWRMKQIAVDIVILNEKLVSYAEDFQIFLESMVRESQLLSSHSDHEQHGAVFVMQSNQLSLEDRLLLQTVARVMLVSSRGTLAEQLLRHIRPAATFIETEVYPASMFPALPVAIPPMEFFNGLGGFCDNGREYVIVLDNNQWTPAPWINVIANAEFGFLVSESGSGCTWAGNSRENQLTPWSNDPVCDPPGEVFYIRDDDNMATWTPTALPIRVENTSYVIHHGQGYSRFKHHSHGIYSELLQFVSLDDPIKISTLTLTNKSGKTRRLSLANYTEWVLGASRQVTASHVITEICPNTGAVFAYNSFDAEFGTRIAFADLCGLQTAVTGSRAEFIGRNGSLDAPFWRLTNRVGASLDPCAALETRIELKPNETKEIVFLLGQANDREQAVTLINRYRQSSTQEQLKRVTDSWDNILNKVQIKTPERELDILMNRWLLYQTLSCRLWARAGFYQAGGAFGFRDQLQDCMALAITRPDLTRAHILRAAAHQFAEGDVQHWWHPPSDRGVRTHFSDDRIWLAFAVTHYIKVTGDSDILNQVLPFLDGAILTPEQEDAYFEPTVSAEKASLFEHCARALDISLATGVNGLPLMGSGDWNDGMNRVGHQGRGESVWLAWFLIATLPEFASLAEQRGETDRALGWQAHSDRLKQAVEQTAWDGAWYRRAYFDDGSPLGSAANAECRIDSIAQSWGIISGAADKERARRAMNSVREYLIRHGDDLLLLFTPPFDKTDRDPGYIKSYPPGIRENGGQYTHAAIWTVIAYAMLGEGGLAMELLRMLNPVNRTINRAGIYAYKVEPYVLSADIYSEPPHSRRGGWTWYTGASGWFYRAGLEWIAGFNVRADYLTFKPCIPETWRSYSIVYQHRSSCYEISIENPEGITHGVSRIELDGECQSDTDGIRLQDDGQTHQVRVLMGFSGTADQASDEKKGL